MTIQQQHIRTAPSRRRRAVLPRITWSGIGLTLLIGYFSYVTWPAQTIAALIIVFVLAVLAVVTSFRPGRLAPFFHHVDQIAARIPKRSAIPRQATLGRLQTMHHDRFEDAVVERAQQSPLVAHASRTGQTRDRGCDGLVHLTNGTRWLIQCKRYSPKNKVGGETVRTTAGAATQAGCTNAAIVTTSGYTTEAHEAARALGVVLFDGNDTAAWMNGGRPPWA
jgi:restriction system protein